MKSDLNDSLRKISGITEPEKDLWPDIEGNLSQKGSGHVRHFPVPLSLAAGAAIMLLGLLLGLGISGSLQRSRGFYPFAQTVEKEYNAIRPASFSHIRQDSNLPTDSVDRIENELMSMERTASVLLDLLRENPHDDRVYGEILRLYRRMYRVIRSLGDYARKSVPPAEI